MNSIDLHLLEIGNFLNERKVNPRVGPSIEIHTKVAVVRILCRLKAVVQSLQGQIALIQIPGVPTPVDLHLN